MDILLTLTGLLALASGTIKLLGKGKRLPGVPLLALLELAAGFGVPFLALTRDLPPGRGLLLLALALGAVFLSTGYQVHRTRAERRRHLSTEDARLFTYVKYLSKREEGDAAGPDGPGRPD